VLTLDDAHVVRLRDRGVSTLRGQVEELREQVLRLVAQLRRSRHPQLVEPELEHCRGRAREAEAAWPTSRDAKPREADSPEASRRSSTRGTEGERRAVLAAYLDRVVLRRGSEPLSGRVLLLLRGEESAFGPLPGRGRKVAMQPWPEFPRRALAVAGTREQAR
jgi:hypothetical protein